MSLNPSPPEGIPELIWEMLKRSDLETVLAEFWISTQDPELRTRIEKAILDLYQLQKRAGY